MKFKGAIFDLDGVISKTEKVHARAWKEMFDAFLLSRSKFKKEIFVEFNLHDDYVKFVDGKPRLEGIKSFLSSRSISIDDGETHQKDELNISQLGQIKDKIFREIISNDGVEVYQTAIDLIYKLKKRDVDLFVASSSKNCRRVLKSCNLTPLFNSVFDGTDLEKYNIPGKPHPGLFLKAIEESGLAVSDCVVFEDSVAGVESAKGGGFFTVGVDRSDNPLTLSNSGADIVVDDLAKIDSKKMFL